jgi:hypothetical protein
MINLVSNIEKESRLEVYENKVARKTSGCKMGQGNSGMEKAAYSSPNIIRVIN